MSRNPRYDILFEPVRIGPVTAPNRFYCTPHALGTGNQMPHTRAAMREVRAEGGWGVVNTGYCSIHPSSDDSPLPYCRLWDDEDIKVHALMVDAVHRHGALAGVELWHGGSGTGNRLTRMPLMSASGVSSDSTYPGWMSLSQSRPMDRQDIREYRRWHVDAAKRAKSAGFDIVYVYAGMNFGPYQFLLPWMNKRSDEYGGSLENRVRLIREIVEDMKEAIGQTCAVALRFSTDELLKLPSENYESEAHEVISMLSDLPDLWDVKSSSWVVETASARFTEQGAQEPINGFVKALTSKPVVGVGRFTSPDDMVSQIKRGVLDFIGAARPSIADPFLPNKIDEGREDEIRECIGCNICVSSYHDCVPVRCTQNPTMGEEWRRKWHPERIPPGDPETSVLIVGAGPAGLECALALGQRGFAVTVAEATEELGGRVSIESTLPGLATWARVRDYRTTLLQTMGNVDIYRGSPLSAQDVIDFGCDHAVIATGAQWTREILSTNGYPISGFDGDTVYTPDDIFAGAEPEGPVVIYDFDHYYMGSCLAELLRQRGNEVTIVTPANAVSAWTFMTNELAEIRARMIELGIGIVLEHNLTGFSDGSVQLASIYRGGNARTVDCSSLVVVGIRTGNDSLFQELNSDPDRLADAGISSLRSIGDCRAPGTIAHAVYSGHECARTIDAGESILPYAWERPRIMSTILM
ncbi:Oxidoreductase, FAD/FMN-binding family [uncultured Woeseiaceae bacterium]|uniref:Oxidoreductase, FAD/FMN-binding family n=1 Tax=uncultured Woeseiaceae bacterium TaxID=1983305 RepID=A0A7D9D199_9GAMM|nr:Oxidoreductase, FAD/FMN-binding family [uncultured Woeseiaceae bacterium]